MLYLPEKERFPVVIMSHGFNGSITDFHLTASHFAEHGVGAVCFSFRGGSVQDKSGFPTTEMTLFTEKEDLLSVLDYIKTQPFTEKIFLFGGSQGAMISAMVAEERLDDIAGMVLLYPAFCIDDHGRAQFPRSEDIPETFELFGMSIGRKFFCVLRDFHTFDHIGSFGGPVLILHGDRDAVVPFSYSERAIRKYPNATLLKFENEKHGFTAKGNAEAERLALDFIGKN